jgi:hypothetical protein
MPGGHGSCRCTHGFHLDGGIAARWSAHQVKAPRERRTARASFAGWSLTGSIPLPVAPSLRGTVSSGAAARLIKRTRSRESACVAGYRRSWALIRAAQALRTAACSSSQDDMKLPLLSIKAVAVESARGCMSTHYLSRICVSFSSRSGVCVEIGRGVKRMSSRLGWCSSHSSRYMSVKRMIHGSGDPCGSPSGHP